VQEIGRAAFGKEEYRLKGRNLPECCNSTTIVQFSAKRLLLRFEPTKNWLMPSILTRTLVSANGLVGEEKTSGGDAITPSMGRPAFP